MSTSTQTERTETVGQSCCSNAWEAAYRSFETPEQETQKFVKRLRSLGCLSWPRDARIVEICCGRGNGLVALSKLGFKNIEGLDLSATLVAESRADVPIHLGDCRDLPFDAGSKDIVIVQGGLHHLEKLPNDLNASLSSVDRVLAKDGLFVVVEPWLTPFLKCVHTAAELSLMRRLSAKLDAFAVMIEHERATYENWLARPSEIKGDLETIFVPEISRVAWGKLMFVGRKRSADRATR